MPTVTRSSLFAGAACALASVLAAPRASADLAWNSVTTYSSTQPTTKQDIGTANGTTVSIQFGTATYFGTTTASPAVGTYGTAGTAGTNAAYANGGFSGRNAMQIVADFDNGSATAGVYNNSASILVTVFFTQAVQNVSFPLYDIDNGSTGSGAYNDKITNISAVGRNGTSFVPASITYNGTTTTSAAGGDTSTITSALNSPQDSANANATISFGARPLTQFSFVYTDTGASGTAAHSTIQIIALGDLTFANVPEPSTWAYFAAASGLGCWTLLRRRARQQV